MSQLHDLPAVSQSVDASIRVPLSRVIEAVRTLSGFGRDPLMRAVSLREAQEGLQTVVVTVPGGGTGGGTGDDPDLTPPPNLTGLTASAGLTYVMVEWDAPVYTEGHGHLRTNIYAALRLAGDPLPTFASAERVYSAPGALTIAAIPSEPNTIWHIWAKWETVDGVESSAPTGGLNGVTATTGQDVGHLLEVLEGQLTNSQLHSSLGTRIDLIDAPAATVGSVNQRIASVSARLNSGGDVATAIVNAQATANTANTAAGAAASDAAAALSSATSTASLLTTLQASIATAGANLLPNSSFEVDPSADGVAAGWAAYASVQTATVSQVAGRTGGFSQRIAWVGTNTGVKGLYTDSALNEGGIQGGVRGGWQPNKTYVVSWYARASSGAAGATMSAYWTNAPASTVMLANPALSASAWQRYAFRITTGATVEPNGRLSISILNGSASSGYIEIDDVMVQEGDLLTGYAPGDQAALAASLQIEATTRATQTGALFAQYTVKTDVNGYVSGYGLASTTTGAAPTSAFAVRADSFSVASPSGPGIAPITPFIVRTTPTTINGVTVPVGIYMSSAYLQNGEITNAKLGNAQIDDLKVANVSVAKLIAGTISAGQYIRSTNYIPGSSGFNIPADGAAEFNNVVVRGTVYASAGVFSGALSGAVGTFAGSLSAATGTFAGTYTGFLNADQINAGALRGRNVNASSHTTKGSYLTASTSAGDATVQLHNTDDFNSGGGLAYVFDTSNDRDVFAYSGKTATSLTGVTTSGANAVLAHAAGATVVPWDSRNIAIDQRTNEMRAFGDRGDGTVDELLTLGWINPADFNNGIVDIGKRVSGFSRLALAARSFTGRAAEFSNQSTATSTVSVFNASTGPALTISGSNSSTGLANISNSGSAPSLFVNNTSNGLPLYVQGNATCAGIRIESITDALPSDRSRQQIAFGWRTFGGEFPFTLRVPAYSDGTNWRWFSDDAVAA